MSEAHTTTVEYRHTEECHYYFAACRCGWEGSLRFDVARARADGERHEASDHEGAWWAKYLQLRSEYGAECIMLGMKEGTAQEKATARAALDAHVRTRP